MYIEDPIELAQSVKEKFNNFRKSQIEPITITECYIKNNIKYEVEKSLNGTILSIKSKPKS